ATTVSPTVSVEELARVTVRRPETPSTWSRATSADGSTPTTLAGWLPERPGMVTRMLGAPWTTWLFVSTWPPDVGTMPGPAASAPRPDVPTTVLTSTVAGLTLSAPACW